MRDSHLCTLRPRITTTLLPPSPSLRISLHRVLRPKVVWPSQVADDKTFLPPTSFVFKKRNTAESYQVRGKRRAQTDM
jgi:hypothetical protein